MFSKCLQVLLLLSFFGIVHPYGETFQPCRPLRLDNGRVRPKQRNRLVKFLCAPNYELVGDRYATCRNGRWDSPLPVCVRPGCTPLPIIGSNSIALREHHGAWVVTFCLPGYKLEGSSAIYCDGYKWNDTAPRCVETTVQSSLSCDFEDPGICGWTQDELHDFDWKRWNEKTPSSFILTGPSHDHTYGADKLGYYMYIESSAKEENDTARLLSPVYDYSLSTDGCFQFFYHMFGKDMGGLRVYQKPISLQLTTMLRLPESEQKYLLYQIWGNQGNTWYNDVVQLTPMTEDFQIVLEGVRGASFISDIAVDDVSLQRGAACRAASTPPPVQTCAGRCLQAADVGCGCNTQCLLAGNCCPDFLDLCFGAEETDAVSTSTETLPETQKLVGETTTTIITSPKTTTSTTTPKPTTPRSTTPKPTTPRPPTSRSTTPKPTPPKSTPPKPTPPKPTPPKSPTPKLTTPKSTTPKPTPPKPTAPKLSTPNLTTPKPKTPIPTPKPSPPKPTTVKTTPVTTTSSKNTEDFTETEDIERSKADAQIHLNKMVINVVKEQDKSTWKTAVVTILLLALSLSLVFVALSARTARGRQAIARLRGRTCHDSEVRYLNSADDDDL